MKVFLAGHHYSKMIIPASSWLLRQYMPREFDVYYLNYGDYNGHLYWGEYVSLDSEQVGGKGAWAKYLYNYLKKVKDKYIILGLDDFLINSPIDIEVYNKLLTELGGNVVASRLCDVTWYPPNQYNCGEDGIVRLKDNADYSCTGQYTIWHRLSLLELLKETSDPWGFESRGSKLMQEKHWNCVAAYNPPFKYHTISALSGGDNKIDLGGVNAEDRLFITTNLIKEGNVK